MKEETLPASKETKQPEPVQELKTILPPEPDFLKQYRECYPGVKRFHVTSDNLVFLERDYEQAVSHQQSIGRGELKTY